MRLLGFWFYAKSLGKPNLADRNLKIGSQGNRKAS